MNSFRPRRQGPSMPRAWRRAFLVVALALPASSAAASVADHSLAAIDDARRMTLRFESNRGQAGAGVDFIARGPGYAVWLSANETWFGLSRPSDRGSERGMQLVRMRLVGADPQARGAGEGPLPGVVNSFRGSDPAGWKLGIPTYRRVRYAGVKPGVDWLFYGTPVALEHDLIVSPGIDPASIELAFDGTDRIEVDPDGNLDLHLPGGVMRLKRPVIYQLGDAQRRVPVPGRYELRGDGLVGFAVGSYDGDRPLVIDPIIEYSTYYGGGSAEVGFDIAVNAAGEAYIAGTTTSSNLPTTTGAFDEDGRVGGFSDPGDAFVAKFSADGTSLLWATYLSGRGLDQLFGIALDGAGNVYVVGDTDSTDDLATGSVNEAYPQVNAAQTSFGGATDLVLTKLDPTGSTLLTSTYLGGDDVDRAENELDKPSVAVDSQGRAVVSAVSRSSNFHTVVGCNLASPGPYVVRYTAAGTGIDGCVGTGGDSFVFLRDLVVDASDRALVVGYTGDLNVVTTAGTFSTVKLGVEDIILVRINAAATAVETGSYFGATGDDFANGVALDAAGNVYLTGRSSSLGYPVTIGSAPSAGGDGVVTKLNGALSTVLYSRTVGFSEGFAIAVDALSRATVVGTDNQDAAFLHLSAAGFQDFETFWGGLFPDFAFGVVLDAAGHAYVTGETRSTGFPGDTVQNPSPFQPSLSGNRDAWVVKLLRDDPVPVPVPAIPGGMLPLLAVALAGCAAGWRRMAGGLR